MNPLYIRLLVARIRRWVGGVLSNGLSTRKNVVRVASLELRKWIHSLSTRTNFCSSGVFGHRLNPAEFFYLTWCECEEDTRRYPLYTTGFKRGPLEAGVRPNLQCNTTCNGSERRATAETSVRCSSQTTTYRRERLDFPCRTVCPTVCLPLQ